MIEFIDEHKMCWGVEPICKELPIAPATYYAARKRVPSDRTLRDEYLKGEIQGVYDDNFRVYGADKVWAQLNREDIKVARCSVERLDAPDGHPGLWWRPLATEQKVGLMKLTKQGLQAGITSRDYKQGLQAGIKELEDS